ncbi:MAG: PHP domain-containing protein [Chitinophagaceae bacterium]|nr:MAG: PHP domain-containing protein [Chitinophagaceae bacterium]
MSYIELQVTTNFTFLRGASHPEEMVMHAAKLGYSEIGITDRNSFAGIVRAHSAAKKAGIRIIPGCRLDLDGMQRRRLRLFVDKLKRLLSNTTNQSALMCHHWKQRGLVGERIPASGHSLGLECIDASYPEVTLVRPD